MSPGALDGVLVADFSRVLAGPYATMLLADLGAEVVKVERPGTGDDTRAWGPPWDADGRSTYFLGVNRNKRSADPRPQGPRRTSSAARGLARRADVVVENFIPGTMDALRARLRRPSRLDNPGVVYASISGFGVGRGRDPARLRPAGPGDGRADVGHRSGPGISPRRWASRSSTSSPGCTRRSASSRRCATATGPARASGWR